MRLELSIKLVGYISGCYFGEVVYYRKFGR
jgi:hypothetical protein